jgi:outer membrane protein assembly factor BamB
MRSLALLTPALLSFVCACTSLPPGPVEHTVLLQGKGKLASHAPGDAIQSMDWGPIHDIHVLENDHVMVQRGRSEICEIDFATGEIVWSYDSASAGGNEGRPVEVHAFQPLPGGRVMIAESGPGRIIEVDRATGRIVHTFKLELDRPHPHTDTRLARKLDSGHYLVCHEGDGKVREYDAEGRVVWSYEVPMFGREPKGGHGPDSFGNKCFSAVRLPSGNTLIGTGNGHSVLEVTPDHQIVWSLTQDELPGIRLAWVTTLEVLPNGHYVIGNCHAGPGQPLLVEVDPETKNVVWTFDEFEAYGNSVSNATLLDARAAVLR